MPYKDPEAAKRRARAYYKANKEQVLAQQRTYKNRCRGRAGEGVSPEQWKALCVLFDGCCAHCGAKVGLKALTRDHLLPLSRGGVDTASNVVPSCRGCNRAHGTQFMCEWKPGSFRCTCPKCVKPGQCTYMVECECLLCVVISEAAE